MDDLKEAHQKSIRHRAEILASNQCGCFYCLAIFPATEIQDWCDSQWHPEGATALCPYCGVDAVIGDASGYQITAEFLTDLNRRWF